MPVTLFLAKNLLLKLELIIGSSEAKVIFLKRQNQKRYEKMAKENSQSAPWPFEFAQSDFFIARKTNPLEQLFWFLKNQGDQKTLRSI
ncbi:MAG: hypothetical protein A4S09_17140 [Proteobacteria bacterium SG_bin7]|nr:MAG: hypothetical protein A4S09_17140 [Proteobacteria bacterium SG_bin7]